MENRVFIGLGSNLQDRFFYLKEALKTLEANEKINVLTLSSIYETEPVGYTDQGSFLNMVVEICTSLTLRELLTQLQKIELSYGRNRDITWGPRTLDLDILLYNQEDVTSEDLIVPHPRMHERAFVIIPLLEINQEITIHGRKVKDIYMEMELIDREGVQLWKRRNGEGVYELFEN